MGHRGDRSARSSELLRNLNPITSSGGIAAEQFDGFFAAVSLNRNRGYAAGRRHKHANSALIEESIYMEPRARLRLILDRLAMDGGDVNKFLAGRL
jgi:hypothetical protein